MLASSIREELEFAQIQEQEAEFIQKLSKTLLDSVVDQHTRSKLPGSLNEDLFENILRAAFAKLPDSTLKQSLLSNISRHATSLFESYQDRIPVELGKRSKRGQSPKEQRKKPKFDVSLKTSDFPYLFTKKSLQKHLKALESLPFTAGNENQYNVLLWNKFLEGSALYSYFALARRGALSYNESVERIEKIILLSAEDIAYERSNYLVRALTEELETSLHPNGKEINLSRDQLFTLFNLTKKFLSLLSIVTREQPQDFLRLLSFLIEIGANLPEAIPHIYTITLSIAGPQNGKNLLLVLAEVNQVNADVLCFFRHALSNVLVNAKDLDVIEMARLLIVAKNSFPLLSQREQTKFALAICKIDISDTTRRELGSLNHTIPREKIIEHIMDSISAERLKLLIHEENHSDQLTAKKSSGVEKPDSLFFIDTGAPKPQESRQEASSSEEVSDDESSPMEFFE